jgi:hypothetical protein
MEVSMENRKYILSQSLTMLIGELILSAVMVAVFAVLGYYETGVLLGAVVGSLVATLNHTVLIIGVLSASKKAENQDVKGGQAAIQMSYMGRLLGLFLILVLCAKSGVFNLLALVIPLLFARPLLTVSDHFNQKKGGTNL